jgi:hypothetical protein
MQELQLKFTEVAAQLSVLKNKEKEFSESRYEQIRMESEIEGLKGLLIKKMEEQPTTPIPNPAQSNTVVSETQDLASGPEMNKSSFDQTERPTSGSRMPVLPSSELESINEKIAELTGLNGQLIKENEALKQDNFTLKGKLRFCLSTYINPNDTQPTFSSVKLTNAAPAPSREVNLLASQ